MTEGTPEKKIQENILKYLRSVSGGYFFKVQQGKFSMIGISDIIGVYNGRFCAIEVKNDKGKLSALQEIFLKRVEACGGIAICVRSVEEVQEWIK